MVSSALRPRSVTEIVDAAFQIFRTNAGPLVMCSAVAYVPTLLVRLLLVGDPARLQEDPSRIASFAMLSAWTSLVSLFTYALMTALLTVCASQAYLGEEVDVGAAVRRVAAKLPAILGATIIVSLMTIVGFALLFAPAMYLTARYFAITPAIVLEDRALFASFTRSGELSKGRKWHILNTLGLVVLIYFVLYLGLVLVGALVGGFIFQSMLAAAVTVVLYPIIVTTGVLLYYDARVQSEGLDIELMVDALGPAPRPVAS